MSDVLHWVPVWQLIFYKIAALLWWRLNVMSHCVALWHIGWVDAFRPEGRGFEFRSSRHVGSLGKSFTFHLQLPVAFRRVSSDKVSIAVVGSASERLIAVRSTIEMDKYKTIQSYMCDLSKPFVSRLVVSNLLSGPDLQSTSADPSRWRFYFEWTPAYVTLAPRYDLTVLYKPRVIS